MEAFLAGIGLMVFGCVWWFIGPAVSVWWTEGTGGRLGGLDPATAKRVRRMPRVLARWFVAPIIVALGAAIIFQALR